MKYNVLHMILMHKKRKLSYNFSIVFFFFFFLMKTGFNRINLYFYVLHAKINRFMYNMIYFITCGFIKNMLKLLFCR